MIIDLIVLFIFILSFGGILFISIRKIPVLIDLPKNGTTGIEKHKLVINFRDRIKNIILFFENQIFLHKLLSWIKVIILKIEVKVDSLLHKIRKRAQLANRKPKNKN